MRPLRSWALVPRSADPCCCWVCPWSPMGCCAQWLHRRAGTQTLETQLEAADPACGACGAARDSAASPPNPMYTCCLISETLIPVSLAADDVGLLGVETPAVLPLNYKKTEGFHWPQSFSKPISRMRKLRPPKEGQIHSSAGYKATVYFTPSSCPKTDLRSLKISNSQMMPTHPQQNKFSLTQYLERNTRHQICSPSLLARKELQELRAVWTPSPGWNTAMPPGAGT
ncbi:hypothetical protein H8959_006826 [Pygathrix nigripes]